MVYREPIITVKIRKNELAIANAKLFVAGIKFECNAWTETEKVNDYLIIKVYSYSPVSPKLIKGYLYDTVRKDDIVSVI